jgi:hypothetical protein
MGAAKALLCRNIMDACETREHGRDCRMDLPGPTTLVGTKTDYSVGPWDYLICATRYLMA